MDKGEKEGKKAIKSWGARKVLRVKKEVEVNMRENEEREEDCYILDSDPNDSLIIDLSKTSISSDLDAADISVLAEKGQVASRDYPHSRHLCLKYPFGKTPHETHCELCYCFVCDTAAPCDQWSTGVHNGHCHAIDDWDWMYMRRQMRNSNATYTSSSSE